MPNNYPKHIKHLIKKYELEDDTQENPDALTYDGEQAITDRDIKS